MENKQNMVVKHDVHVSIKKRERERDPPTGFSRLLVEFGRGVNADGSVSFPSSLCSICKDNC